MTFDLVYKFLTNGSEIRRHGSEMVKYRMSKDKKQLLEGKRLLDRKTWVEFPATLNSYDIVATDWEVVLPPDAKD
jgi:hypothetical protein